MSDVNFNSTDNKAFSADLADGLIVTNDTSSAQFDISGTGPTQVTGLEVNITTAVANEEVEISASTNYQSLGTTRSQTQLGYQVDSDSVVLVTVYTKDASGGSGNVFPLHFREKVTIASAGAHTIKIMAQEDIGTDTSRFPSGVPMQVTQFRSGQVSLIASSEKDDADSAAADVTAEHMIVQPPASITVSKIFYLPDAALTAVDTNFATVLVSRRDSSGGTKTTVAGLTTEVASGNWVAFDGKDLGTLSVSTVAAGEVLTWEITKTGSGIVVPAGTLQVEYSID